MRAAFQLPVYDGLSGFLPVAFFPTEILHQDRLRATISRAVALRYPPMGAISRQVQMVFSPEWFHMLAASKALYTCIQTA
jgi:hypothetical protein